MKKQLIVYGLILVLGGSYSCKGKKNDNASETSTTTTTNTNTQPNSAPVEVSGDEQLRQGVRDATKDFPDVNATVDNGVITLSGSIQKDRYITLKQSLDALRPKQVINNLQYK